MAGLERVVGSGRAVTARAATRRKRVSGSGCLETAAIVVFAILLGGFAASTWMRHAGGGDEPPAPIAASDSLTGPPLERSRIRVEVRNSSGVPGAAARVTEYLRQAGFDVVDFGNAAEFGQRRTIVIDRVGAPDRAREVAAALRGVPIESRIDTTLYLDVTVLVGRDAPDLVGGAETSEGGRWRAWLDRVRGLWR